MKVSCDTVATMRKSRIRIRSRRRCRQRETVSGNNAIVTTLMLAGVSYRSAPTTSVSANPGSAVSTRTVRIAPSSEAFEIGSDA